MGFLDESGFSDQPCVRSTWSPKGRTPILVSPFNWKRLSAIAALVTTGKGWRVRRCLRLFNGPVRSPQVCSYLSDLRRYLKGRRLILLWDRLQAHKSNKTQAYLRRPRHWLNAEYLPPYAPELNAVEYFWQSVSGTEMANFCGDHLGEVRRQVRKGANRVRRRPALGRAFLKHTGLF